MTLIDAGPLIALLDRADTDHGVCAEALRTLKGPFVTTWAVMTEAMHVLRARAGPEASEALLGLVGRGDVEIRELPPTITPRLLSLLRKYRDVPMDFGDATLVVLAEELNLAQVFTLDRDFRVYRFRGRLHFRMTP